MKLWRYGQPVEYLGRRYRLDGMLGSGGMADVCLAWDEREQREVALKILKSDDLDQETLNRFMKEAAQIAHWQHPHILRVYESLQIELIDAASGSVLFYMVSEYARGGDLHKRLTPGRAFPLSASFALFRQLCDAVQYAHERGVIHRDLKPLNILFRRPEDGPEEVVLSDFGLAVQVDASHHTFAHGGTLAYMAPEQFQGRALPASDIFALGVILYLLCTGTLPFRRTLQDMQRVIQGQAPQPTRPALLNPELPPALDDVILRSLRELPAERYRQPRDLWQAIETVLTASARTFPFAEDYWQHAGQTWPFEPGQTGKQAGDMPDRGYHQASQLGQLPGAPFLLSNEEAREEQEGSDSALRIAREKQKASPVRLPLPTYSIPAPPNPSEYIPTEENAGGDDGMEAAFSPAWPGDYAPTPAVDSGSPAGPVWETPSRAQQAEASAPYSSTERSRPPRASRAPDPWANTRPRVNGERPGSRSPAQQRSTSFETTPAPPSRQAPAASASGSTILPAPRVLPRDDEQTSRRHQPIEFAPNTIPRRASYPAELDDEFEPDTAAPRDSFTGYPRRPASTPAPASHSRAPQTSARRQPLQTTPTPAWNLRPRPAPRSRSRRVPLIAMLSGLVLLGLLIAIFAAASYQGHLLNLLGAPVVKVTLQPRSQLLQQDTTLTARLDGGPLNPGEIPARQLTATSPTQSTTATATGSSQGKKASGQLTFINNTANAITISSTILTGNSGVKISFNGPITIPANPPTTIVSGFAVDPGTAGNIPTLDISKACCAPGNDIFVKNTAFTGGQDAVTNGIIQQKDIDGAAKGLAASGETVARGMVQGMVKANERVVGDAQCQPKVSANQKAGDLAKQVTVQVAVTCSEVVYDYDAARRTLAANLQQMASADPTLGPAYALVGHVVLSVINYNINTQQTLVNMRVHAQGLWVYQFSGAALRNFATLVAGKSLDSARELLLRQPGVSGVQFGTNSALPVNTSEIQLVIQNPPAPA